MTLTFKQSNDTTVLEIKNWLQADALGKQFLSSYLTDDFAAFIDGIKRFLWVVVRNDTPVGFFDFEIESVQIGYCTLYVRPEFRGQGMGELILKSALILPPVLSVTIVEGGIKKDNIASIKTFERAGFCYSETDDDGFLLYQYKNNY